MYILIFIIICIANLLVLGKGRRAEAILYYMVFILLTAMLALRFGQGTDYLGYYSSYNTLLTFSEAIKSTLHGEIGFKLLCAAGNILGLRFEMFVFIISIFEMMMLHRFVSRYSSNRLFSLLLFFPTGYLTFFFSAIRQGIVTAVFLGYMLRYIEQKKWARYACVTLLLFLIHSQALILLIVPITIKISQKNCYVILVACVFIGFVLNTDYMTVQLGRLPLIGSSIYSYLAGGTYSILGILERSTTFGSIVYLYTVNKDKDEMTQKMMNMYTVGVGIYYLFMADGLIAGRGIYAFKALEIALLPRLIIKKSRFRQIIVLFFVILSCLMFYKNIMSYIQQGRYYVGFFEYPYISVFNKSDLWEYRRILVSIPRS